MVGFWPPWGPGTGSKILLQVRSCDPPGRLRVAELVGYVTWSPFISLKLRIWNTLFFVVLCFFLDRLCDWTLFLQSASGCELCTRPPWPSGVTQSKRPGCKTGTSPIQLNFVCFCLFYQVAIVSELLFTLLHLKPGVCDLFFFSLALWTLPLCCFLGQWPSSAKPISARGKALISVVRQTHIRSDCHGRCGPLM